jgi:hypothetical protein
MREEQCYFKRSLSHGKLIIPRHPIGSLNASVAGLIVSVYTSIGEPASSNSVGRSNHFNLTLPLKRDAAKRISLSEERKTRIRKHIENDEKENIICQG